MVIMQALLKQLYKIYKIIYFALHSKTGQSLKTVTVSETGR